MRPIIWNDLDLLARKIAALHEEDRLPAAESIISPRNGSGLYDLR